MFLHMTIFIGIAIKVIFKPFFIIDHSKKQIQSKTLRIQKKSTCNCITKITLKNWLIPDLSDFENSTYKSLLSSRLKI